MNTDLVEFPLVFDTLYGNGILDVPSDKIMHEWKDLFKLLEIKKTPDIFLDIIKICEETYNLPSPVFIAVDIVIGNSYKILKYKESSNEWKTYYDSLLNSSRMGKFPYIESKGLPLPKTCLLTKYKENRKAIEYKKYCYEVIVLWMM